jgi:hypothetical protein
MIVYIQAQRNTIPMYEGTIVSDDGLSQELAYELRHLSSGPPLTFLNVFPASDGQCSGRSEVAVASSQQYQPSTFRVDSDQPDYSLSMVGKRSERSVSASTVSGYSATPESSALNVRRPRSHPGQGKCKVTKAGQRNKVARSREEDSRRKQLGPIAPPIPRLTFEALAEWALKYRGCHVASSIDDKTSTRNLNDRSERQKWGHEQLNSFKKHVQGGKGGSTICSICFVADGIFLPKRTKKQEEACRCMPVSEEDREKYPKLPNSARWWRPEYPPT